MNTPKESTTKVEPWDGAKPYLTDIYKQYSDLIASGAPKQWEGSTVADQSRATRAGQGGVINYASNPQNMSGIYNAQNAVSDIAGGSAYSSPYTSTASDALTKGTNYYNPAVGMTQGIVDGITTDYVNPATSQAAKYNTYSNSALGLQQGLADSLASGTNPYLDKAVSNSTQRIADQLGRVTLPTLGGAAASAGRLGSNAFASGLNDANSTAADAMSKAATDMYAQQYNADIANRLNANAQLANTDNSQQSQRLAGTQLYGDLNNAAAQINNTAQGLKLQGAGQIGSLNDSAQGLRNSAASSLWNGQNAQANTENAIANTRLQAASMAGDQYQNGLLPWQALLGIGQTQDERSQNILSNTIQRYEQGQQQPLTNLGNFANLLNGGGYSNTTSPVYSNTGGQILGGLVSLLGLL